MVERWDIRRLIRLQDSVVSTPSLVEMQDGAIISTPALNANFNTILIAVTEDDTFRRLRQRPYEEVTEAVWSNNMRDYKAIETKDLLRYYGWTEAEYKNEWERRNPRYIGG